MRLIDADKVEKITWQEPSYSDAPLVLTEVREKVKELSTIEAIPISFIREITERDICLVYRGCLLMLLDKWEREKDTYVER